MADIKYNPEKIIKTLKDTENKINSKLYKKATSPKKLKEKKISIVKSGVIDYLNEQGTLSDEERRERKRAKKQRYKARKAKRDATGRKAKNFQSIKSRVKKGKHKLYKLNDVNKPAEKKSIQRVGGSGGVHTANRKSKAAQGKQAPVVYSYKKKVSEGVERFDKLVKSIKASDVSKDQSVRLLRIAGKVRKIKEATVMNKKSLATQGPVVDVEVIPDKKEIGQSKKGGQITKKKDTSFEKSKEREPNTYSKRKKGGPIQKYQKPDKKKDKNGKPVNWKKAREKARDVAGAVVKATKAAAGGFTAGFDPSQNVKEEVSRRKKPSAVRKQKKLEKALATLQLKKKKLQNEGAALAIPLYKLAGAALTTIGAGGMIYQSRKKSTKGQGNFFPKGSTENPYSGRYQKGGKTKQNKTARNNAIDQWRKDNGLPPDSKALPPWAGK